MIRKVAMAAALVLPLAACASFGSVRADEKRTASCMARILQDSLGVEDVQTRMSYAIREQRYHPVVQYRFSDADGRKASTEIAVGTRAEGGYAYWPDEAIGVDAAVLMAWSTACRADGVGLPVWGADG
jgi:hypothetical protein